MLVTIPAVAIRRTAQSNVDAITFPLPEIFLLFKSKN
jgi:hypothetical protein